MLLREIKNIFHLELDELYPKEEVDSFFHIIVEHYLSLERFVLVVQPNLNVSNEDEGPLFEALAELKLNRPVQHIIGKTTFMDLDFFVDENVLIPRPETEELVRWILEEVQSTKYEVRSKEVNSKIKILDIGTGSGCIAIALAKNISNRKVYALDISEKALNVAAENANLNEVEIEFFQVDILGEVSIDKKFDVIVSNPPYVRESEKKEIAKNVKDFEPNLALFVPDNNPLLFYEAIARFANKNLDEGGKLFLEINQYLAKDTERLLKEYNFQDIELRKDIFDNDRMLKGTFLSSEC